MNRLTRRVVSVVGAIAALAILAACASSNEPGRETATVSDQMVDSPMAEFVGVLGSNDEADIVYFTAESDDGKEFGLVLPDGFTSSEDGEQVLDEEGGVVAVIGEQYSFSGGEYALGNDVWADGPEVDSLWLTGTISGRD